MKNERRKPGRWMAVALFIIHYSLFIPSSASGQTADSARVFSFNDFAELILKNHPIVRQAALLPEEARQEVMQARGAFDPKVASGFDRKEFGGLDYYNNWANELKVPVWSGGADLKVTYDRFVGPYTPRMQQTTNVGLAGINLSVPLGQGMLIDARRSTLRQAQFMVNIAEADRIKQINKVWFDAAKDYWEWYLASQQVRLLQEGFDLADTRFQAVRQRTLIGDAATIDSVEAKITVQDRQVQLEQALVQLQNTRLILSTYLWSPEGQPLELPERAAPQAAYLAPIGLDVVERLQRRAGEFHPELLKLDGKLRQLTVEERFRRELLKPQINLSAGLLSRPPVFSTESPTKYGFAWDNHKIGVDFVFPLFLRKERGKLRQVQIKAQQTTLERQQTNRDVLNGVAGAYNELKALERQITVQETAVQNQRTLLRAEQQKFDLGESTLFLVNSRETKLIDMQVKLEELKSKYQKAVAGLYYASGSTS
ncbi:TolC family protein [Tellurirhabdus rosea]|uniref:TolC family protein n=1 Tax=Tellurirhabdus rosea TaxID=2674997 RepID=UPI00225465D4|nr:TolC family protein [Tellurirhabdus rosea]